MTPWRKGAQGSRDRASQALAWTHRTNYVAIQQVVKQSQPVSRMTFDKLSLSLTLLIRISTMICYAYVANLPITEVEGHYPCS
jgi:hypothetical protein